MRGTASGSCRCGTTTRSSCARISPTSPTSAGGPAAALPPPAFSPASPARCAGRTSTSPAQRGRAAAKRAPRRGQCRFWCASRCAAPARNKLLTTIDFYFNAEDRFQVACRLAGKALAQKKRMLIYAPEPEAASRIDKLLWTWPAIGFVPHCAPHDALAAQNPVLIASDPGSPGERELEVVPTDEAERQAARARYRFYQSRGYKITSHDLARDAQ